MQTLNDNPTKLKYLWAAELADGTLERQTPEDISYLDPARNCYYDLIQLTKHGPEKIIRRFSLLSEENTITVDLGNGIFYINGLPVLLESEKLPILPDKFDLIYYHQVTQNTNVNFDPKTGEILDREPLPEYREYFLGWQCNINGKNYQQKLAVS